MTIIIREPTPEEVAEATALVGTWFQVSRKHRMIARFPEGKTPKEALRSVMGKYTGLPERDILPREEEWIEALGNDSAGDQFLGVYSGYYEGLHKTLSVVGFKAFRAAGGDTYGGYMFRTRGKVV
jgi:hypothetical protein